MLFLFVIIYAAGDSAFIGYLFLWNPDGLNETLEGVTFGRVLLLLSNGRSAMLF
jgi:hypothetical protein